MPKVIVLPNGQQVALVDREQLRFRLHGRTLRVPAHLEGLLDTAALPTPPPAQDWSKGRTIQYPILGNDREGDCYLADALHCIQTWTGNNGTPATFDTAKVLALYEQLSGGDNGLDDGLIFPAWKKGLFGHKIIDEMTVDPKDDAAIRLGLYLFGGGSYTASLLDTWLNNVKDGATWDANGRPDPSAGHAMHLSGYTPSVYQDETWALRINLTPAGLKASHPEVTVQFSLEWFNAQGVAPNGLTYDQLAALWHQLGGQTLPPSPFGPPTPPTPPNPGPVTGTLRVVGSVWFDFPSVAAGVKGTVKGSCKIVGPVPQSVADVEFTPEEE